MAHSSAPVHCAVHLVASTADGGGKGRQGKRRKRFITSIAHRSEQYRGTENMHTYSAYFVHATSEAQAMHPPFSFPPRQGRPFRRL